MLPFRHRGRHVEVRLGLDERRLIADLPAFVEQARAEDGPAAQRLAYVAHPDDPERQESFADMTDSLLAQERAHDARRFAETLHDSTLTEDDAMAWMRLIGEGRLVLASRLGITQNGWEADDEVDDPELAMLHFLGWLQDALVRALPV